MYTTTMAFSYAVEPASSNNRRRTFLTTLLFASGGIVGWPFALALAFPFIGEELFVFGSDHVPLQDRWSWAVSRWKRLLAAGATALLLFVRLLFLPLLHFNTSFLQIPVIAIDTVAYGRLAIVPWNIVRYNIFGGSERGPELYGTAPWTFYFLNLILNFNILFPLALLSLPSLYVTYIFDRKRLGIHKPSPDETSPFSLLALRLAPLYLWLGILTSQPHKEERFMFPAYPLLCFNAATTLYLIRGWFEVSFVSFTRSPYKVSRFPFLFTFFMSYSIL